MQARHELTIGADDVEHGFAHAGHEFLVHGHIGAVGQLNANVCNVRAQGAHGERHHIHGAALHATVEQRVQGLAHFGGGHPVVGGAGVFFLF